MSTIRDALEQGTQTLTQIDQVNARLDVQILLAYVLHVERSVLFAYPERTLTPQQERQFLKLVERRKRGEPVAYLTGHKEFYGLDFVVNKQVLIPRPETELLVETALSVCRRILEGVPTGKGDTWVAPTDSGRKPIVADIGTGSGVIPITLAVQEPRLPYLYASDISIEALKVAYRNCQRHHVDKRVRLLHGDLLTPLPEPVDLLTANLPYVGTNELDVLASDVLAYEPDLALFSGPDGLDLLRRFFIQLQQSNKLLPGGVLLLEIGYRQREPLTRLLYELWPQAVIAFLKDYSGWDRVLQVTL